DLLIVSSHRLDRESINLGAYTTYFKPSSNSCGFLNKGSIQKANALFKDGDAEEASVMPALYQLKQVRSKFNQVSTYTRCRVSSDLTSPMELQPCTIWTLADQDWTISQEKLASSIFQKIAIKVIRHGQNC
ncbi:hypothetical protein BD770DRAFT_317379, partial [Pilaira anomala]